MAASISSSKRGVLVVFNDRIYSARNITKINPSALDAFAGNEFALLGHIKEDESEFLDSSNKIFIFNNEFNIDSIDTLPEVCIIYGHLGMQTTFIEAAINANMKGIISAGMGDGEWISI